MGMIDDMMGALGGQDLSALGGLLGGADESATKGVLGAALPAILGAMANNASKPGGGDSLFGALQKDHDGSVLDDLGGFLGSPNTDDGNGILGHVFGNNRPQVEQNIAQKSGFDLGMIMKFLPVIAPLIMGYLGRKTRQDHMDAGALTNSLQQEKQAAEAGGFDFGSILGMLDSDQDGDIKDDVMKMGGSWLQRLFGKRG